MIFQQFKNENWSKYESLRSTKIVSVHNSRSMGWICIYCPSHHGVVEILTFVSNECRCTTKGGKGADVLNTTSTQIAVAVFNISTHLSPLPSCIGARISPRLSRIDCLGYHDIAEIFTGSRIVARRATWWRPLPPRWWMWRHLCGSGLRHVYFLSPFAHR